MTYNARLWFPVATLLFTLVPACEDTVMVNERILEIDDAGMIVRQKTAGCLDLPSDGTATSAGAGAEDFSVSMRATSRGISVQTFSQGQPLESRELSEATLRSRQLQSFRVRTVAGKTFELRYWGGQVCDPFEVNEPQK